MFNLMKRARRLKKKLFLIKKNKKAKVIMKQLCKCGNNLKVFGNVEIIYPERISVGDDCRLNSNVYLNGRSSIEIGDDVTLSYGAKIITSGYDLDLWLNTGVKKHFENQPVYVGNHCWIGTDAIILPGVSITGEYVVVAAGAVVTKSVEESRIVLAGIPAKIVKTLE